LLYLSEDCSGWIEPQGPSEVEIHPAGSAKALTLPQAPEVLQLGGRNIRKVQ
jgi:hypothetical protein